MAKEQFCASIEQLREQFLTLDWTYHDFPVGDQSEKMFCWPGPPDEEILICVHQSGGRQELFHRHDFFYQMCIRDRHLLLTTELPNSEISYRCGFSDPKYFYATFKEWWGCTPTEHRNHYRTYLRQRPRLAVLNGNEAASFLKDYITCLLYTSFQFIYGRKIGFV